MNKHSFTHASLPRLARDVIELFVDDVRREDVVGRDLVVQLLEERDHPVELHLLVDDLRGPG